MAHEVDGQSRARASASGFPEQLKVSSGQVWPTAVQHGRQTPDEGCNRGVTMADQMTKAQLVAALAEQTKTDKKAASTMLDALSGIITCTVSEGGAVTLPGVGKIYCRERPERMARNPATGEQIKKDADKVIKVTVAKALKDSINA
jgi:DNA-binding protein HU-beta